MQGQTTEEHIEGLLQKAANAVYKSIPEHLEFSVNFDVVHPKAEFGDYASNLPLVLAKQLKMSPQEIGEKIITELKKLDEQKVFGEIYLAAGFINFRVSPEFLMDKLGKIIEQGDLYGCSIIGGGKKILVEYFQPNVAKPLHLGHLRTAIIGDALFRIFASQGYKVESDTHLGDWGTQFGLLILAFKKYGKMEIIEKDPINKLNQLYVQINEEAEKDPQIHEQGKAEFLKLEQGDKENRQLWQKFRDWTWKEFEIIYTDLGVRRADHDWGESFFEDKMPAVISELKAKGLLQESQGAQIVDLEKYQLGIALVVKSDGGTTYLLRDLATYIYRKAQGYLKQFYVVDVRQKHALAQTFKILELLGHISTPNEAIHVAYGFLTLPEGAMSTRKGVVVGAADFVKNVQKEALKIIEEKNPELKNKAEIAKQVAAAAIKYFDLSHNLKSDIVFDPKKAISFEGNTGPYLQYTHARIYGIIRKADHDMIQIKPESVKELLGNIKINKHELTVMRKLHQFPEVVEKVSKDYLPNLLANYLFELAQSFNSFYQKVPVKAEEDERLRNFRFILVHATAQVLKTGLYLLGIEAPEEM